MLEQLLKPDVVRVLYTIGEDSTGEPSILFRVLLSDAASKPNRLYKVSTHVRSEIERRIDPLNSWGLVPYVRFRSQSEQQMLQDPAWD